jgi:hypothetical protein
MNYGISGYGYEQGCREALNKSLMSVLRVKRDNHRGRAMQVVAGTTMKDHNGVAPWGAWPEGPATRRSGSGGTGKTGSAALPLPMR